MYGPFPGCKDDVGVDGHVSGLLMPVGGLPAWGEFGGHGGHGDGGDVAVLALAEAAHPDQQTVAGRLLAALDHGEQAVAGEHEIASDVAGALRGNAEQPLLIGALSLVSGSRMYR